MLQPIIHGFLLALGLILPLGAQNVFVFNQGANQKKLIGALPVIITAGLCDTLLIVLAILGMSLILMSLPILQLIIYIIGLVFLLYMAWSLWKEKPDKLQNFEPMSAKKQIGFALSVSLLNPHAIMDTIGVIGTSASVYNGLDKVLFTAATVSVSWLWFIFLAIAGRLLGSVDKTGRYIVILNKVSSIIILIVSFVIIKNIFKILIP
ncbi:LysE/ArgO family amino acid transporter [Staphylococcus carnosus]|uniref:LysE type translocator n=1 Tax=Staphylococcus carnosus (strain TM300) TaxID=396513 RepID=B9DLJ9_STACT|nr:LysE/ArgO family amino acid transporter [Staphylococcus carnosus]KOR12213.1 lysine transporter LysE [Staphylococcus carnosus]QPT03200.1 amino acid transporter [Staphylococcus carnosus]UQA68203.1 LysE/ArgO family amino acid transporter [Staphylococcus carnosus]UTB79234.1 lysine transporter LysE [Staphylococcus carnosus]UTB81618.1 lysine transporter LysE [Staphylococcus carnosus]